VWREHRSGVLFDLELRVADLIEFHTFSNEEGFDIVAMFEAVIWPGEAR